MQHLRGRPISPGYARGTAVIHVDSLIEPPQYGILHTQVAAEHQRFQEALERCWQELELVSRRALFELGQAQSAIFLAHLSMLRDEHFVSKVKQRVSQDLVNAEHAVHREITDLAALLAAVDDRYFRERAQDIRDVGRRVLNQLMRREGAFSRLASDSVVVAAELLPSETYDLDRQHVVALVTEFGGENSHAAILARSLGIPAVTGVADATKCIEPGMPLLVDGQAGSVTVEPDNFEQTHFYGLKRHYEQYVSLTEAIEGEACVTQDGVRVGLFANIGRPEEARLVSLRHLEGVGLFRTEFLFLESSQWPTLERQRASYSRVIEILGNRSLVIRTFDLGGDKTPAFLASENLNSVARGLRWSLEQEDLLMTQLRAVVDCCSLPNANVRILFPMVLGGHDLREAIALLEYTSMECGRRERPVVGAMIETPSALFTLDEIVERADFLSIGTNDLTQFMLAADRNLAASSDECSVLHPAVLRGISKVVQKAQVKQRPVSVCGEAAGNPRIACLLVGLGVRELSMSPVRAASVRFALRNLGCDEASEIASQALRCESALEVRELLAAFENCQF